MILSPSFVCLMITTNFLFLRLEVSFNFLNTSCQIRLGTRVSESLAGKNFQMLDKMIHNSTSRRKSRGTEAQKEDRFFRGRQITYMIDSIRWCCGIFWEKNEDTWVWSTQRHGNPSAVIIKILLERQKEQILADCRTEIAITSTPPLDQQSFGHNISSEGKSEQIVTWFRNLNFQHKIDDGSSGSSNWSSDICCLCCRTIELCGKSTRKRSSYSSTFLAHRSRTWNLCWLTETMWKTL